MNDRVLIKYEANWSDEFDLYGFATNSAAAWNEHLAKIKAKFDEGSLGEGVECWFGTNEAIEYHSFDDYEQAFTVMPITDAEEAVLRKLFGSTRHSNVSFGHIKTIDE